MAASEKTACNVLRTQDENDWHSGEDIDLLAALAALLHDLGKARVAFQRPLDNPWKGRSGYGYDWVSLRLFEAFVKNDDDTKWLARPARPETGHLDAWKGESGLECDRHRTAWPSPFKGLEQAPLAQAGVNCRIGG
jgi:CRISPR-associated endonuclease/helicase Cas3